MKGVSSTTTVVAAIVANIAIACTKLVAGAMTGSSAMLSEGIHSAVDTGDGVLMLVGIRRSRLPADEKHPFGYGKELYFWTLIVGILVFALGGGLSLYEGISFLRGTTETSGWLINLVVLGVSAVFESSSFLVAWRRFRAYRRAHPEATTALEAIHTSKDPSSFTVLLEDTAGLAGLAIAGAGVTLTHLTGSGVYDGVASMLIACLLASVAFVLAFESHGLLLGESALRGVVKGIRSVATTLPGVEHVERVLTMQMGVQQVVVALDVVFKRGLSAEELGETARRLEGVVREGRPYVRHVYIDARSIRV